MPLNKLSIPIPSSGLAVDKPAEFIDARSISNCQNIQINRHLVKKKFGSDALGSSLGERILGMAELESGINAYFVRVGLTEAEVINKSTLIWTSIANAPLTATEDVQVSFAFPVLSGSRIMVYSNSIDNIRKYTGTGNDADLGGTPPKCRYMVDFGGYLVLAYVIDGGTDFFTRVQWSDTGNPQEWSAGNAGSVELLEDSLPITGISRFGNFLSVHKESCIYLGQIVSTSDVFRFTRKETGSGTSAHGSIQNLPDGTQIYLAKDGLRLFNGAASTLIPSPIIEELRDSVNPRWISRATSVLARDLDEYWVGIPIGSQTEPETIYKYNYRTGQVFKDTKTGLMSMSLYKLVDDETWDDDSDSWDSDTTVWDSSNESALHRQIVFGDENGVTTIKSNSSNDNDTAIDSIWDTKDFTITDLTDGGSFGSLVRWEGLDVWALGGSITLYYSTDSGSSWNLVETKELTSDYPTDDSPSIFYFDVVSSKMRFRFRNNILDSSFTLKQYVINYVLREERK